MKNDEYSPSVLPSRSRHLWKVSPAMSLDWDNYLRLFSLGQCRITLFGLLGMGCTLLLWTNAIKFTLVASCKTIGQEIAKSGRRDREFVLRLERSSGQLEKKSEKTHESYLSTVIADALLSRFGKLGKVHVAERFDCDWIRAAIVSEFQRSVSGQFWDTRLVFVFYSTR